MLSRIFKVTAFRLALLIGVLWGVAHFVWRARPPDVFPFPELSLLEGKALDIKFKRRGPVPSSGQVVIAGVDERSVQRYGLWPWKRSLVAKALENLNGAGALAVGVDITYSDSDRSSPHRAINAIVDELLAKTRAAPPLPALEAEARRVEPKVRQQLAVLQQTARDYRAVLDDLGRAAASGRLEDPDLLFAGALKASPRVVLGIAGLGGADLTEVSAEVRARDAKALERFGLSELYDADGQVVTPEGERVRDWGPVFKERVTDLRRLPASDALQGPLPIFAEAVHHVGLIDALQDPDGMIRRYALAKRVGDRIYPSLGLATAAVALRAQVVPLKSAVQADGLDALGLMAGAAGDGLRRAIPVDPWTGLLLIDYPGPARATVGGKPLYDTLSLSDAVDGGFDPKRVEGKVVLVGATAIGTFDQRVTPFDPFVPGVYTHAAVIDNILTNRFFVQTPGLALAEIALLLALAVLFGLAIPRLHIGGQLAFMAVAMGLYGAVDYWLFERGVALSSVMPLTEMIALCFGLVTFNYVTVDREKRQVRTAFQFYLTKSVMEEMLRHPEKLKLGGDKRELTVLFSDIRGFTTISEKLPPEELVRSLNEYLTPMTDLVFKHQGTLDKYMGDAIMAIWGAPLPQEDHALRACAAAVEMLEALGELRKRWRELGRPDIDIGIGLNTGMMSVGNMGSAMRFDYTVMGDSVNLGSRLEGTNKEYGTRIIISQFTYAHVKGKVVARELGSVRVKGKLEPVGIYELRGMGTPAGEEAEAIAAFEQGLAAYRARRWDEAEALFGRVCTLWPEDRPSTLYLEDLADKRQHPPGPEWDGVKVMKTK